jgi:hypothetical protein
LFKASRTTSGQSSLGFKSCMPHCIPHVVEYNSKPMTYSCFAKLTPEYLRSSRKCPLALPVSNTSSPEGLGEAHWSGPSPVGQDTLPVSLVELRRIAGSEEDEEVRIDTPLHLVDGS